MQRPIHDHELSPNIDSVFHAEIATRRRQEFLSALTQPDYVVATDLVVQEKTFADIRSPLAIRDDIDKFGVLQILHAIVRKGDEAYGVVSAFGSGPLKEGFLFAVLLAEEPYATQPEHVAHLQKGKQVSFGSRHLLAGISASQKFWALRKFKRESAPSTVQLITAVPLGDGQEHQGILAEEVGTWARPPGAVRAKAAKTKKFKKPQMGSESSTIALEQRARLVPAATKQSSRRGHPRHRAGNRADFRRHGERAAEESLALMDLFGVNARLH